MRSALFDAFGVAIRALTKNGVRSVLTTGGVVVGIFFVLVTGWVLSGLDRAFVDSFAFFGEDVLYVSRFSWGEFDKSEFQRRDLSMHEFERFSDGFSADVRVVPMLVKNLQSVRHEDLRVDGGLLYGTSAEYINMFGGALAEGRFFLDSEVQNASAVVVLGHGVAKRFGRTIDLVGQVVLLDGIRYRVVGILPKRGTLLLDFIDNIALVPIRKYSRTYGATSLMIGVQPKVPRAGDDLEGRVTGRMRAVRRIGPGEPNDFGVNSQELFSDIVENTRRGVWGVGLFMTGLAFLVGSIGIMNIMFVAVSERTREIGIRKSVGAKGSAILAQFLVESTLLSLTGAGIGVGITAMLVWLRELVLDALLGLVGLFGVDTAEVSIDLSILPDSIPTDQIVVAVIVAGIVGVLAGMIPAFRASRLSPVEALRSD